jgi:repressor LexA
MTSDLTPRQQSVLEYVIAFQQKHRMAPTVREICAHLGLSGPAGIHRILNVLKDKGYILAEPGKKRAWRFSKAVTGAGIPLIGTIAAGRPVEAIENLERELAISPALFGCKRCFGLRVKGDSMIEAHILDGDLAIIRPQPRVENGEIAAVMVQNLLPEATLKIVRRKRGVLSLEPANAAYAALVFKGPQRKQVVVLGKYVGIVRKA